MKFNLLVSIFVCVIGTINAAPWLDWIFNEPQPQVNSGYRNPKSGKESYKQLCRVLNPDNYAFPDKVPYPAAPVCPY